MTKVVTLLAGGLLCVGCGVRPAPPMVVEIECRSNDLVLQIESGATVTDCAAELATLAGLRAVYEMRFGAVEMPGPVRLRATDDLGTTGGPEGAAAATYGDAIDLTLGHEKALPHELNHVRLGPSSAHHHGWCADFFPWQDQTLAIPASSWGCH